MLYEWAKGGCALFHGLGSLVLGVLSCGWSLVGYDVHRGRSVVEICVRRRYV
jgi:hypothetical protein